MMMLDPKNYLEEDDMINAHIYKHSLITHFVQEVK